MESLSDEIWDVVIVGTSLPQALLALSLSRSQLKVLHLDKHDYYGGTDAGLSLDEARSWAKTHDSDGSLCSHAQVAPKPATVSNLAASRAYTLNLNPQIVYASSSFLPALVTSRIHNQLEFLAVGSWWIHQDKNLKKIPSTREDVFADDALSRKDKIGLMKFLRHVLQDESAEGEEPEFEHNTSLEQALSSKFKIRQALQLPLSALALATEPAGVVPFNTAVSRIRRHMTSMGHFGPGFAAVYPKYAGNAEVAQVACRAGAVGGAVYLLNQGVAAIDIPSESRTEPLQLHLVDGPTVRTRHLVASRADLPLQNFNALQPQTAADCTMLRSISIVSSPLKHLFPQTSENGTTPAVAIVLADEPQSESANPSPIYMQIHSEDTGECPVGQCVIYSQIQIPAVDKELDNHRGQIGIAVHDLITQPTRSSQQEPSSNSDQAEILWSMSYVASGLAIGTQIAEPYSHDTAGNILAFPPQSLDMSFDDKLLDSVKAVWKKIVGKEAGESQFMRFEDRVKDDE